MTCACGAPAEPTCSSCGRQNLSCPSCGGGISADPAAVVVSCPYCDSDLAHTTRDGSPPFFPVNLTEAQAQARLLRFCLNRFGIPGDFEATHRPLSAKLVFVPIHLFTVTAHLTDTITETDTCAVLGVEGLWYEDALDDHGFAVRVRQHLDPEKVPGTVLRPTRSAEDAGARAERFGQTLLAADRKRFSEVAGVGVVEVASEGRVHYPLYEMQTRYGGRSYRAVVDASNGVVCTAAHPVNSRSRALVVGAGLAMLASTAALVVGFVGAGFLLRDTAMLGAFAGAGVSGCVGLAASARVLWAALRRHQSRDESGDRAAAIEIVALDRAVAVPKRLRIPADGAP